MFYKTDIIFLLFYKNSHRTCLDSVGYQVPAQVIKVEVVNGKGDQPLIFGLYVEVREQKLIGLLLFED